MQKLSVAAFIISILPLMTVIPVLFHVSLTDGVRSMWAGANILAVIAGLLLSIICVKNRESRNVISILSTIISFWMLLMCGMVSLALFLNFAQ